MNDFYTISETAEALGVSTESIRRAIRDGKLESVKPFKRRLVPKWSVDAMLRKPGAS
ncbi:MAG: helix-turn-helix domain-containing protein [Myxococcales bacterium]|nr:helix-turn-helix domain-containing protein [Myxococcales bacterium]